jgi:tripartite-type tricarboxylate transporter receptor subunit TctC
MKLPRRKFLHLAAGAAAFPVATRIASAQNYPSRPVHIIVGFPPGGANDVNARLIGQWLSERLGQPFVIENRPGAGSNIGTELVVRSAPDGYTVLLVGPTAAINATLYEKLNFNFVRDIAPVASIVREPLIMVVNPSVPAKTVPEFIASAKANPGKINMSSAGNGTVVHVGGELFKMLTGVEMIHVPYKGAGPAISDLLGGQVQVMFATAPSSIEFVPGYEASGFYGLGVPKNTPLEVIDMLNKEVNAGLADPKLRARLADTGGTVLAGSPTDFGKLIAEEPDKWGKVIRAANIKPD